MKISYNLLQTYFDKKLPDAKEVISLLERHLAEVEDVEEKGDDTVFDVNILPDRAPYALGHEAIAFELSALLGEDFEKREFATLSADLLKIDASVDEATLCDRQIFVKIENVDNEKETPLEIKKVLESLSQRSISFLVDLTNFAMLDVRQPLHIFDAEKVIGKITIRKGKEGEKVTTLDGKDLAVDESMLVIADEEGPLDIAGIKGGKKAEVTKTTKNIILTASHFDAVSIRQTSQKVGIKTDASKRFENNISAKYVEVGAMVFLKLLEKYCPESKIVSFIDINNFTDKEKNISVPHEFIDEKIGVKIGATKIEEILQKIDLKVSLTDGVFEVVVPEYRKDLNIKEDIVDEIARTLGYDAVEATLPQIKEKGEKEKIFNLSNKARNFLNSLGFSEIFTHALLESGEVALANPLASDKAYLRTNLSFSLEKALKENIYYADLLGLSQVKVFEIGKVFRKDREFTSLSVGIGFKKASKGESVNEEIKKVRDLFVETFGSKAQTLCTVDDSGGIINLSGKQIGVINNLDGIFEIDFDAFIEELPNEEISLERNFSSEKMKRISSFPFITRDIAFFVQGEVHKEEELKENLKNLAGENLQNIYLFDLFEKKNKETGIVEKISYGFRLVFQSFEKTLTDVEVEPIVAQIYDDLKSKGFEIR
ncbi:MAG: Phenylalanine--tRNA ligase beta subunit [Patescibacteria group bacterium]|jgi:phenylalanyl-tRNA synthetase beta chain|nr:Phenylalanine--tRNA ligase beta subunit [Patescibacteria group bacterium]